MDVGVTFPQLEIGTDPAEIRRYGQTVEALGYDLISVTEHIVGVADSRRGDSGPANTYRDTFHEPLVLLGHLAAVTDRIHFATGVMVLPQRQTVLVAKQAAQVDVLSEGRFRLGVGVGWNEPEYDALGMDFAARGSRIEEQVSLLRQLWENDLVSFDGTWDAIDDAGINPRPVQQPIPIWMGGGAEAVLRRTAAIADGWISSHEDIDVVADKIDRLREYLRDSGRDPDIFPIVGRVGLNPDSPIGVPDVDAVVERAERWSELGASHLLIRTVNAGFADTDEHLRTIERCQERLTMAGFEFDAPA